MAPRIGYDVPPTETGPDARQELDRLLATLHEKGVLRLANDLVGANTDIARVLIGGLSKKGTLDAIQNLSILLMVLSRIEPDQFYRMAFAVKDAVAAVGAHRPAENGDGAPGLGGAYRMLNDDDLWRALRPLFAGLEAFASGLEREPEKPISAFTGKPSRS